MSLLRSAGVAVALALAFSAQALFEGTVRPQISSTQLLLAGGIGLLGASVLFGLAMPRPSDEEDIEAGPVGTVASTYLIAVAIASYTVCMVLYRQAGESINVHAAWAMAVCFLIAACWTRQSRRSATPLARRAISCIAWGTLLALALAARLWRLDSLPRQLTAEVFGAGNEARYMLDGTHPGIIGFGWSYIPRLGFLPEVASIALFGANLFGVMMAGVITGMASLVATGLLATELYGARVAWLATALLAFSYTHIHFSRVPPHIHPLPFVTFALFYLVRAIRTGRELDAVLAGLGAGLAFQMYFPGRIVVALYGLVALHLLLRRRLLLRQWSLIALGFVIALGPMAIFFIDNWDMFMDRTREVSVFRPKMMEHLKAAYGGVSESYVLLRGFQRAFLTFSYYRNAWFERDLGRAFLDPFSAPLLALGLGYCLIGARRAANWLVAGGFLLIVVVGVALTSEPPFWQRMTVAMPFIAILVSLPIERLARLMPLPRGAIAALLAAVAGAIGWWNWTYFVAHESKRDSALAETSRFAAAQPADRPLVIVTLPWQPVFDENQFFLARDHLRWIVSPEDARAGRWPDVPEPLTVIFTPHYVDLLFAVRARWPNGEASQVKLADGRTTALHVYEVDNAPGSSRRGSASAHLELGRP